MKEKTNNNFKEYFKQLEEQFKLNLDENIKNECIERIKNNNIIVKGNKSYGKTLMTHLVKLYDFYQTNTLQNVVKLCDYFYIVKLNRPENRKTDIYCIATIGTNYIIGEIRWWGAWRKYCFFPNEDTVYDNKCMLQIMNFMNEVNLARYKDKENENAN